MVRESASLNPLLFALSAAVRHGRFQQLGTEVFHVDENGQIKEFWALIDDTGASDEFFA